MLGNLQGLKPGRMLASLALTLVLSGPALAQTQSFHVDGRVDNASFSPYFPSSPVKPGDRLVGTLLFHLPTPAEPTGWIDASYQIGSARFAGS